MRSKTILIVVVLLTLASGVRRLSAARPLAPGGSLDSPGPPESTYLYTLEDIYNRLLNGTAGAPTPFTEPSAGPTTGTGHTLHEIMAQAPAVDDANGATPSDVSSGKTFWGLTSGQWGLLTGTADIFINFAPVPKTGQTISYTVRDDGDLEKGVDWPNPRFTNNDNGTITDNLTGLIWLKDANCAGGYITWALAISYTNALYDGCTDCFGTLGDCGLSDGSIAGDWRLPSVRELQSLVHYGVWDPAVPNTAGTGQWTEGNPFSGVQSKDYWSSTTLAHSTASAWVVDMLYGRVYYYGKAGPDYVWPVRGGQ